MAQCWNWVIFNFTILWFHKSLSLSMGEVWISCTKSGLLLAHLLKCTKRMKMLQMGFHGVAGMNHSNHPLCRAPGCHAHVWGMKQSRKKNSAPWVGGQESPFFLHSLGKEPNFGSPDWWTLWVLTRLFMTRLIICISKGTTAPFSDTDLWEASLPLPSLPLGLMREVQLFTQPR